MNETEELINIMQGNLALCESDKDLYASIIQTRKDQKLIREKDRLEQPVKEYSIPAKIVIQRKRTLESAGEYKGSKIAVLNFANAYYPGGGCLIGAKAQEECLCRCSTLYESLIAPDMLENFYNRHRQKKNKYGFSDIIYSPDIQVIMTDTSIPKIIDKADRYSVNILTCAAPDLSKAKFINRRELLKVLYDRCDKIFQIAACEGNEVLILGAFGCGVFNNPPEIVAKVMMSLAKKYRYCFKAIVFAVYDKIGQTKNYITFLKTYLNSDLCIKNFNERIENFYGSSNNRPDRTEQNRSTQR